MYIAATNGASAEAARRAWKPDRQRELGKIYTGKVVRITDFGAFVEIMPRHRWHECTISQLAIIGAPTVESVVKARR